MLSTFKLFIATSALLKTKKLFADRKTCFGGFEWKLLPAILTSTGILVKFTTILGKLTGFSGNGSDHISVWHSDHE